MRKEDPPAGVIEGKSNSRTHLNRKAALSIGFGLALFMLLVSQVSFRDVAEVVSGVRPGMLVTALVLAVLVTPLRAYRYTHFAALRSPFILAYAAFAWFRVANYVLPFRSGEFAALLILKRHRLASTVVGASATWAGLRLLDVASLAALFGTTLILYPTVAQRHPSVIWVAVVLLFTSMALTVLMPAFRTRLSNYCSRVEGDGWWWRQLKKFEEGLRMLSWRRIVVGFGLGAVIWGLNLLSGGYTLLAFAPGMQWVEAILVSVLAMVLSLIPIRTPLGLGTGDVIWVAVLSMAGIEFDNAVILALGVRLVQMSVVGLDALLGAVLGSFLAKK